MFNEQTQSNEKTDLNQREIKDLQNRFENMQEKLNTIQINMNNNKKKSDSSTFGAESSSENKNENEKKPGVEITDQLMKQMDEFKKQAEEQQNQTQIKLEKSIKIAIETLEDANNQIVSNQALIQLNQDIEQAKYHLKQMESFTSQKSINKI